VAYGRDVFTLDPARSAVLVIDMQNAFVAPGATYETPKARAIVANLERLLECARAHGMVVWTRSDHSPPYGGVLLKTMDLLFGRVMTTDETLSELDDAAAGVLAGGAATEPRPAGAR
jgi:nicotinamidase-related amidase